MISTIYCIGPSDFIWDFRKQSFPSHLGKYFITIGKMSAKINEIGKIKTIFELEMTPIYGLKNGQIKSLGPDRHFGKIHFKQIQHFNPCRDDYFCVLHSSSSLIFILLTYSIRIVLSIRLENTMDPDQLA